MEHTFVDTVVVFEMRPTWTPELQRQWRSRSVRVRGCRAIADIDDGLNGSRMGVVVLDLDGDAESCLRYLDRRMERWRGVPVVAVGSERMRELEWSVRELGATSFVCGRVKGAELADCCQRLWA